jgi:uncharacterized membrane protein YqjE
MPTPTSTEPTDTTVNSSMAAGTYEAQQQKAAYMLQMIQTKCLCTIEYAEKMARKIQLFLHLFVISF